MAARPRIAIVGPGRLGTTLALQLNRAGYTISEIVAQNKAESQRRARSLAKPVTARATPLSRAHLDADLIWFCVPDRAIAAAARELSQAVRWKGKTALHSSGALASRELDALRKQGAAAASVHPLMTFVRGAAPSLRGVPFAIEGDMAAVRVARRVVQDLGGLAFGIRQRHKPAYHAWGAFTSPLLVALLATAEQVARRSGLTATEARKKMLPILRQTVENYGRLGPAGAFSGPLVRGDVEIVSQHLRVLKAIPGAKQVYGSLGRAALLYLPVGQRKKMQQILNDGSPSRPATRRSS